MTGTIAYLTSAYARASDTFIRGEVEQLRALGWTVHTFSVRKSPVHEAVSDEIKREQENTEYLLHRNAGQLFGAGLKILITRPGRFLSAARLAMKTSPPGIKARLWQLAYLFEAALLARRMESKGVQHLHNHIGENSASVAMLASILSGIPYSLTIHGPNEFDRPERLALEEKIARAKFAVAVSDFGRSQLFRWCNFRDWDKIHVIHCGVNGSFLNQPPAAMPEAKRLVCIGRIAEQKGQFLLVEAAAVLHREGVDFELIFIGDGPMKDQLLQRIKALGLHEKVRVAGWMASDQVRQQLIGARVMVLPSFAEGLPVVIMESLALGRPVISTWIAGIPELVSDGENGWLVPAGSSKELAQAMRQALGTAPARLAEMGRAGAKKVAENHNAAVEAARLATLIRSGIS